MDYPQAQRLKATHMAHMTRVNTMKLLPAMTRSMRNDIWPAPCGKAGVVTTAEAASKRTVSRQCCAIPCPAVDALFKTTRPIVDREGLRSLGRRDPNPNCCSQSLHSSWHAYNGACTLRMTRVLSGVRRRPTFTRFVKQIPFLAYNLHYRLIHHLRPQLPVGEKVPSPWHCLKT